jgi:putative FmdB family regulatory protein
MPNYKYKCTECSSTQEEFHYMSEKPEISCTACGAPSKRVISLNTSGVKTGFGATEQIKEEKIQRKKGAKLKMRQIDRWGTSGGVSLAPNVDGEDVGTWKEAKKMAESRGKDGREFDRLISVEERSKNIRRVDEDKWKKAKEDLGKA